MSRINVRYYKAHPIKKEIEVSPATYLLWHGIAPEQQEKFIQWSKDMNAAINNLAEHVNDALLKAFREVQPTLKKEMERWKNANSL